MIVEKGTGFGKKPVKYIKVYGDRSSTTSANGTSVAQVSGKNGESGQNVNQQSENQTTVYPPESKRDIEEYELKGSVRKIAEMEYASSTLTSKTTLEFNQYGNLTEGHLYDIQGNLMNSTLYQYDGNNRLVKKLHADRSGKRIDEQVFMYNSGGYLIEGISKDSTGGVIGSIKYVYYPSGKIKEALTCDPTGALAYKNAYEYNASGKPTSDITLSVDGQILKRTVAQYDKKMRLIRQDEYDNERFLNGVEFEYNAKDQLIRKRYYEIEPNYMVDMEEISYDKNGSIVSDSYTMKHLTGKASYTYDSNLNWTKRIKESSNEPSATTTLREITYY
jgi:hypothetical protein